MSGASSTIGHGGPRTLPEDAAGPAYEMLPINSDAARAAVAVLANDRAHLLAVQGVTVDTGRATTLLRESGALGLYEDSLLIGCLVLRTDPDVRHRGPGGHDAGLLIAFDPATVGTTQVGRLLTLWLANHAARTRLTWVWCEVPSPSDLAAGSSVCGSAPRPGPRWPQRSPSRTPGRPRRYARRERICPCHPDQRRTLHDARAPRSLQPQGALPRPAGLGAAVWRPAYLGVR